ncbi:unnamed protein product [Boreogadus saida]
MSKLCDWLRAAAEQRLDLRSWCVQWQAVLAAWRKLSQAISRQRTKDKREKAIDGEREEEGDSGIEKQGDRDREKEGMFRRIQVHVQDSGHMRETKRDSAELASSLALKT